MQDTPKPLSRQRLWQIRKNAEGLCAICAEPRAPTSKHFCAKHQEQQRNNSLLRARIAYGKPLDAPIRKGVRRGQNPLVGRQFAPASAATKAHSGALDQLGGCKGCGD